ncbi:MAG: dihydrodipicolinate synthase family protein [Planctomycetaceae bacterium]|nr:dihydrodipicolinate synthase family protein [Planctomycetaceae bacterium]
MSLLARLATVQIVPPTPFSADGKRVLTEPLAALAKELYAAGMRVFLPAAGTGEFHSLSTDEVVECVRVVRQSVGRDAVVLAPLGFALQESLTIGRGAIEAGADALLIMPPVHPYLADCGFRDYFQALAQELSLPFLAYKRGPVPSDKLLLDLAQTGRLIGVKYAVNELDGFTRFALAAPATLGLYCGTAERYAPFFMLAGAAGYTSGAGNVCPRLTLAMHAHLAAGRYADAMRIMQLIRPIEDYRAREGDSFNITLLKYALELKGLPFGPPRAPQRQLNDAERSDIRRLIEVVLNEEAKLAS